MHFNQIKFYEQQFSNQDDFISFLKNEKNTYADFILSKYFRPPLIEGEIQLHHIQPKHSNGTDDTWNIIALTVEEHAFAHQLLYECYGNYYDYSAWCLMTGKTAEGLKAMRRQNQLNMKKKKVGFYDSNLQRELATRPKKQRERYARNSYVKAALQRGFVLQSTRTRSMVMIQPNECKNLHDVLDVWLSHPEMDEQYQRWTQAVVKEKFSLYTGLTRCLVGHRDKKTKKAVYTVAGWSVLGIFL